MWHLFLSNIFAGQELIRPSDLCKVGPDGCNCGSKQTRRHGVGSRRFFFCHYDGSSLVEDLYLRALRHLSSLLLLCCQSAGKWKDNCGFG